MGGEMKLYSRRIQAIVEESLPATIQRAMVRCGWDAYLIYELIDNEIKAEKAGASKTQS